MPLVKRLLSEQRMSLAMAEVAWRGDDQFGNFVRVLEFGAVDLDTGARVAEEGLRHCLNDSSFSRTGGTKE